MLDRLPPQALHLLLLVAPVVLGWVSTDEVPQLHDVNPTVAGLVAAAASQGLLWVSSLTRQYGYGTGPEAGAGD